MRWSDERYVRLYTRDTPDWLALSFEAQALFCLLLRKVDRAGILPLGKAGKRGVAVVLGQVAIWDRLAPALEELIGDGCVRVADGVLVVPNFVEAQEAAASDAQRQREARARARDLAGARESRNVTGPSRNVTPASQPVTTRHSLSQPVTPNCAVPSRAVPSLEITNGSVRSPEATPTTSPAPLPPREQAQRDRQDDDARRNVLIALVAELGRRGFTAALPSRAHTAAEVARAVSAVTVPVAADRVMARVRADRAAGVIPREGLGWHLDTIRGTPSNGARAPLTNPRAAQPVGTDFTKTLADIPENA